jgi:hypothetical protein
MKTKELRLGNLVVYNNQIVKTAGLHYGMFECGNPDEENWMCTGRLSEVHPIELTEEILVKIGFKKGYNEIHSKTIKDDFYEYNVSYQNVSDNKYSFVAYGYKNGELKRQMILDNIQYLHQLQNAYYLLTNEELEVNL